MANKFKKGDVVVLKSGGPKMTVTGFWQGFYDKMPSDDRYNTVWFKENDPQHSDFHEDVLELAEPKTTNE